VKDFDHHGRVLASVRLDDIDDIIDLDATLVTVNQDQNQVLDLTFDVRSAVARKLHRGATGDLVSRTEQVVGKRFPRDSPPGTAEWPPHIGRALWNSSHLKMQC
jgi:hypothetical protein